MFGFRDCEPVGGEEEFGEGGCAEALEGREAVEVQVEVRQSAEGTERRERGDAVVREREGGQVPEEVLGPAAEEARGEAGDASAAEDQLVHAEALGLGVVRSQRGGRFSSFYDRRARRIVKCAPRQSPRALRLR